MISLRLLETGDIPFADELRRLAGWNQTRGDWANYLRLAPDGCFLAEVDGQPAGTATTIRYGTEEAWIGMVLVHPRYRRMGLGTALLRHAIAHLQTAGTRCIKLDATPAGKPLYHRLGFSEEYDLVRFEGSAMTGPNGHFPAAITLVPEMLPAVTRFDAGTFGVDRGRVLETLHQIQPEWSFVARSGAEVSGYLMAREGAEAVQIGPFAARGGGEAESLLRTAFNRMEGRRIFIDVPKPNRSGCELVAGLGFKIQRILTRMYLGDNRHAGIPSGIFSIGGPEKG